MRQRNELVPFMLLRHDDERQAVRELTEKEYESVVGGSFDPKSEVASCCDTTTYRLQQDHRCLHGDPGRTQSTTSALVQAMGRRALPAARCLCGRYGFRLSRRFSRAQIDVYGLAVRQLFSSFRASAVAGRRARHAKNADGAKPSPHGLCGHHCRYAWRLLVSRSHQDDAWGWLDDIVGGKIGDAFASAFCRAVAS